MSARDWLAWHRGYDETGSPLGQRLSVVRVHVADALTAAPPGGIRVVSLCAGDGRDLIGTLSKHPRRRDVRARLVELDPALAAVARTAAAAAGLDGIEVVTGDASTTRAFDGAVPANVVLVCGVFGNISDEDVAHTVRTLPSLCAPGASVVWTRHRRPPDLTVDVRRWYADAGFEEVAFETGPAGFGVGTHHLTSAPPPFKPGLTLFRFVGYDALGGRT